MFGSKESCPKCKSSLKEQFDFCPYCGCDVRNAEKDLQEYGLLGKNESAETPLMNNGAGLGDKFLGSILSQLMKTFEAQLRDVGGAELHQVPNGIQIRIGGAPQTKQARTKNRKISDEQIQRMAGVPRVEAKTNVRRLSDKIVYELKTPDVNSVEDIFVSRVESGYEVKLIGKNKVYLNSLQIDLPLKSYGLSEKGAVFEFGMQ